MQELIEARDKLQDELDTEAVAIETAKRAGLNVSEAEKAWKLKLEKYGEACDNIHRLVKSWEYKVTVF